MRALFPSLVTILCLPPSWDTLTELHPTPDSLLGRAGSLINPTGTEGRGFLKQRDLVFWDVGGPSSSISDDNSCSW